MFTAALHSSFMMNSIQIFHSRCREMFMMERQKGPIVESVGKASTDLTLTAHELVPLVDSLGTDRFLDSLLALAHQRIRADFVSVFCLNRDETPLLMGTRARVSDVRAKLAAKGYQHHFRTDIDHRIMCEDRQFGDFTTYQRR